MMTKEFIEAQIALLQWGIKDAKLEMYQNIKHINNLTEAVEYWKQHPVIQEGKEEKVDRVQLQQDIDELLDTHFAKIPTDDEQHECEHNNNYSCKNCQ